MNDKMNTEEQYLFECVIAARKIQTFLWGHTNGQWGLDEWRRMFRKRWIKIDDINSNNPHAIVELRKRILQNVALGIALLGELKQGPIPETSTVPTNLAEYSTERRNYEE